MSKIGIIAIGTGERLNRLLSDMLARHGDICELRGMSDESETALGIASALFGRDIPTNTDYSAILDEVEADWIFIGSKNHLHRDHCVAAFARDKHVFCEKPMAVTIEQCIDILLAYQKAGTFFMTGFVLRFAPLYRKIYDLICEGMLGKIISAEANEHLHFDHGGYILRNWRRHRSQNGPYLLEKCCHDLDILNWLINSIPTRVASFAGLDIFTQANKPVTDKLSRPDDDPPMYRAWNNWEDIDPFLSEKDVEDNQVIILEYRNGARVSFHTNCCNAFQQRRLLLCGLEGTLEAELYSGKIRVQRIGRNEKEQIFHIDEHSMHGGGDSLLIDDLVHNMATCSCPTVSIMEGFISSITALVIDKAMQEGKVVDLESYWDLFGI
ncbi:MAG: Gfo/Idh/MocA family protein [Candidatus Zhuqueibacterota bacterium]